MVPALRGHVGPALARCRRPRARRRLRPPKSRCTSPCARRSCEPRARARARSRRRPRPGASDGTERSPPLRPGLRHGSLPGASTDRGDRARRPSVHDATRAAGAGSKGARAPVRATLAARSKGRPRTTGTPPPDRGDTPPDKGDTPRSRGTPPRSRVTRPETRVTRAQIKGAAARDQRRRGPRSAVTGPEISGDRPEIDGDAPRIDADGSGLERRAAESWRAADPSSFPCRFFEPAHPARVPARSRAETARRRGAAAASHEGLGSHGAAEPPPRLTSTNQ